MTNANFFRDYQAQFEDTQKQVSKLWNDSQKQMMDSQKQLINRWMETVSGATSPDYSENMTKVLSFQQEWINSTLNAQQAAVDLAVDTQKVIWGNYFQTIQTLMQSMPKAS